MAKGSAGKGEPGGMASTGGGNAAFEVSMIPEDYKRLSPEVIAKIKPLTDDPETSDTGQLAARRYLADMGISLKTAIDARIGCLVHRCFGGKDSKDGKDKKNAAGMMYQCIAYVNYINGQPVNVKYRSCDATASGYTKCWSQDSPTTPCPPYNIDCINPLLIAEENIPRLIVTEGERDVLTLREVGYPYVISVPNGAASDLSKGFEAFRPWLDRVQELVICGDSDLPGRTLVKHLADYFGTRCLFTVLPGGCKDISDVLVAYGADVVREIIGSACPHRTSDIITVSERADEIMNVLNGNYDHGYDVGYGPLTDRVFHPTDQGGLIIATGKPNSGKTDFLNDLTCRLMAKTGRNVCYLSFEVPDKNKHMANLIRLMLGKVNTALSNGLRVIHNEDNTTQMVALNLLYDVGARDEDPDHTGFAHLFEHLMFGGSIHVPDYDTPVQNAGGENNAWTNNDITNYYITLPRQNVETGFWLESDRMLSLDFNPRSLEVQRQVVIEEFKQRNLNQPYGDASHLLRALAYKVHPYQWPTIGKEISHIANATLEEVKAFFFKYYAPDNAILAVTGHITFEETVTLAEKWFGPIPRRNVAPRSLPAEPRQTEERRLTVERNVPVDALFMAFHICERRHPDYYAFDMLSDLLSSGRSCRLVQHLVQEKQVFNSIDAYISGSIDEGLFHITGKPAPGVTLEAAEAAVWQELKALTEESVDEDELEKVKNRYESEQIFNNLNYLNVATNLAYFELTGKAEDINNEVNKYRSVTAGQIKEAAQKTFVRENCSTLYYKSNLPT